MKTRILSDLHLGHSASRLHDPEFLRPLLEGVDRLVLAGDVWQERKVGAQREAASDRYEEFLAMIASLEIEVIHLRGNHDPHTGQGVAWLAKRRVLVTHGDAIYQDATPWSREMRRYRQEVNDVVLQFRPREHEAEACAERAMEIALILKPVKLPPLPVPFNFFATAFWPPSRMIEILRVWWTLGEESHRFLERTGGGAQVLICGHFHRAGIWEKKGRVAVNTGSFMQGSQPFLVDLEGDRMWVRKVEFSGGAFHPGAIKGFWELRDGGCGEQAKKMS